MNLLQRLTHIKFKLPILLALLVVGSFIVTYMLTNKDKVESQPVCSGKCVSLMANKAVPSTLVVTPGTYVQFNSADGKAHSLSMGAGGSEHQHTGSFSSGTFKADEAWRVQFKTDGSYTFHDHLNPKINVVVVVYTPGKDYKVK